MTEELQDILRDIRDSQMRLELTHKHLVKQVGAHHLTLYGDDGSEGIVGRQRTLENTVKTTIKNVILILGLVAPLGTALIALLIQIVA